MAGGSSRSAFNVSFAADNNIADVTAKATSQTICTSLVGTAAGIAVASSIGHSPGLALGSYAVIAALHMYSGWRSVQSVPLATLNPARLQLLVARFLLLGGGSPPQQAQQRQQDQQQQQAQDQQQQSKLPSPAEVAALEPILPAAWRQSGWVYHLCGCAARRRLSAPMSVPLDHCNPVHSSLPPACLLAGMACRGWTSARACVT